MRPDKKLEKPAPAGRPRQMPRIEPLERRQLLSAVVQPAWAMGRPVLGPKAFNWSTEVVRSRPLVGPVQINGAKEEVKPRGTENGTKPPGGTGGSGGVAAVMSSLESGALAGKIVYLTAGHGLNATSGTTGVWSTDRGVNNGIVEDYGNQDQLQSFADYILRAGGTVATLRPVGTQSREVVLDNDSAGVTFAGAWSDVTTGLHYDEDYGAVADPVKFRFASISPTQTATATYAPTFAEAGFYPVYSWVTSGTNRANQRYVVNHAGGSTAVSVDHRNVGRGWVYLGTYFFESGQSGSVVVSNQSTSGSIVVADAIRFGNGMGDWNPGTGLSGRPRHEEAGLYWILRSLGVGGGTGRNPGDYDLGDDGDSNISAQPKFARDMNSAPFGQSIYLSFHTNAGGGRGAVGLTNADNGSGNTPNQTRFAFLLGKEVNEDLRAVESQLEAAWSTRTTYTFDSPTIDYGEISSGNTGNEFDATIIELAFHDDATDALFLKSPKARDFLARATYQGVVRYFNEFGGGALQFAPSAPTGLRTRIDLSGNVLLNWAAPPADSVNASSSVNTGPNGYAPTAYEVQISDNGYGFETLATVTMPTYTVPASVMGSDAKYFRIVATNAGGQSPPSAVAGARRSGNLGGGTPRVLIVSGFDRFDSSLSPTQSSSISYDPPSAGSPSTFTRVLPRLSNSFDYVVQAGEAVEAYTVSGAQIGFDSAGNEEIVSGAVSLADYHTVIWLSGEESTADETFSATEQALVSSFLSGGGRLFASGSEIGWDLDRTTGPTTADRSFYNNSLKADYVSDDAGTYNVTPAAGSIFSGLPIVSFDSRSTVYDAEFPDVIAPAGGSAVALHYSGGSGGGVGSGAGAAVQFASASESGPRGVTFGFPFETIASAVDRAAVMSRILDFFQTAVLVDTVAPAVATVAVNDGAVQRSRVTSLTVTFTEAVQLQPGAFTLIRRSDGAAPMISVSNPQNDGRTYLLQFSGSGLQFGSLADGVWDLTVLASAVADLSGNPPAANTAHTFHRLFGDANGDKTVNSADLAAFTPFYGTTQASAGSTFASWFDFDNNSSINNTDLLQLRSRNGIVFVY